VTQRSTRPIADELGDLIAEQGVSIRNLAKRIGVSQPYLSRLIRGVRYTNPTGEFAGRVATELGLPIDYWPEYRAQVVIDHVLADPDYRDAEYDRLR
jgi:transcriptional regulator with XRE-family HTH domain